MSQLRTHLRALDQLRSDVREQMSNAFNKKYNQNFSAERRAPLLCGDVSVKSKNRRLRPFGIEMRWAISSPIDEAPWTTLKRYRTEKERDVALALHERKYASTNFMTFRAV